jgi:secondary thiamine-phosphate synthase enzyme
MSSVKLSISTKRDKQVLDITPKIEDALGRSGVREGLCNVFVAHTTAAITTGESIEGTDEDLMETMQRLIPDIDFRHAHDPSHAPDHMISSILGPGVTLPIVAGKLQLGTWQRVLFVECNGPRNRDCIITFVPA